MFHTKVTNLAWATVAVLLLLGITTGRASELAFAYQMPMQVTLNVNSSSCDNSPGPFITLEGEIALAADDPATAEAAFL